MRSRFISLILFLVATSCASAQIPYFAKTVGLGKMYAYTSMKARPGINSQETYTTFQYGLSNSLATGLDLYTSNGNSYWGGLMRYGVSLSKNFNVGVQVTPSFNLSDNFKFSYLTSALYLNGNITKDGNTFWCANTWWGVNDGAPNTIKQWIYLGHCFKVGKQSSITPMVGEIHSWKMDEDMEMAVGAYYSVKKYNLYLWTDNLFDSHPRIVAGFDVTI